MPCPMCRVEIEDISKWQNTQEEILRLKRVERFSKVKQRFCFNIMRKKNKEIVRLQNMIKKTTKAEDNKTVNKDVKNKKNKEKITIITID